MVAHCKRRRVGKQTWVRANEAAKQGSDVEGWGSGLMDNSAAWQRQSFHLKMVPGLSQKVRAHEC